MIERYSTEEMIKIWSEENKFKTWVLVEKTVNDALMRQKLIPANTLSDSLDKINIQNLVTRSKEIEVEIRHDLNAFVFACEEICGQDGRWIHFGLTSSDILDTTNSLLIKDSGRVIEDALFSLSTALNKKAKENKDNFYIARTHGQLAQVKKTSSFFMNFAYNLSKYVSTSPFNIPAKISGAVGDNAYVSAQVEDEVLRKLGLSCAMGSTQVVQREYYAEMIFNLAMIASMVEKIALQIRLYQQSGIEEMFESFGTKQTGSSAMPFKKNPIMCENLCGLSRVVRGYVGPALENICLWQERDMSHSSVERIVLPDVFNIVHFMIKRITKIIEGLQINQDSINDKIHNFDNKNSQDKLLDLIRKGYSRKEAYRVVQGEKV